MTQRPKASRRPLRLVRSAFPDRPGMDTAVSRSLLLRVSEGAAAETLRLHRAGDVVAFGRRDLVSPGSDAAVAAAVAHGFDAIARLAGGRAAVFHRETVAFSWAIPDPEPPARTRARFAEMAGLVAAALGDLGVNARVGEVPGEYCPGEFSVNAGGRTKLMGVGQRLARAAAHIGGVIVVDDAGRVNDVLGPVYEALRVDWDPARTGAVTAAVPGVTTDDVIAALIGRFGEHYQLTPTDPTPETLERAARLVPEHLVGAGRASR